MPAAAFAKRPEPTASDFVRVKDVDPTIVIDLRYATENNFTKKRVYPLAVCIVRKETAEKLVKANAWFAKRGYRIKIWDAFRPIAVQKIFWEILPDARYVADPNNGGSKHNRGGAVDITLVDKEGRELEMPSAFDDFSDAASPTNPKMSKTAWKNVQMLQEGMTQAGFMVYPHEWWHFDDADWQEYPLADIDLGLFVKEPEAGSKSPGKLKPEEPAPTRKD